MTGAEYIDHPKFPRDEHNNREMFAARWIAKSGRTACSSWGTYDRAAGIAAEKEAGVVVRGFFGGTVPEISINGTFQHWR